MKSELTIIIPARGSNCLIDQTILHAEQVADLVTKAGFSTNVLVADNRRFRKDPLVVDSRTAVYESGDLLAYENFKFGLSKCYSEFALFLAVNDTIEASFIVSALEKLVKHPQLTSILGRIDSGTSSIRKSAFKECSSHLDTQRFCRAPFGWGIYSICRTETMKAVFVDDVDWTDYILTGELCKRGICFLDQPFRFYHIPDNNYIVKSQRQRLNPVPWIKYHLKYALAYSASPSFDIAKALYTTAKNCIKWILNGTQN